MTLAHAAWTMSAPSKLIRLPAISLRAFTAFFVVRPVKFGDAKSTVIHISAPTNCTGARGVHDSSAHRLHGNLAPWKKESWAAALCAPRPRLCAQRASGRLLLRDARQRRFSTRPHGCRIGALPRRFPWPLVARSPPPETTRQTSARSAGATLQSHLAASSMVNVFFLPPRFPREVVSLRRNRSVRHSGQPKEREIEDAGVPRVRRRVIIAHR